MILEDVQYQEPPTARPSHTSSAYLKPTPDIRRDFHYVNNNADDDWDDSGVGDHDDEDDDVDEDLIEGDIEQGSSGEALQDSNGKQVTPTRLKLKM